MQRRRRNPTGAAHGGGAARGGGHWKGKSSIMVTVRCRPMSREERKRSVAKVDVMDDGKVVVVRDPPRDSRDVLRAHRSREKRYAFDHAFGEDVTQEEIYQATSRQLVDGVLQGFNATVLAYGATGSGKTYTMTGTPDNPGIMVLTLRDMYKSIAELRDNQRLQFRVSMSYIEVYNENIRDLLSSTDEHLDLREDPIRGPVVADVTEFEARSTERVMELLQRGNQRRSQEPTAANKESSRSHALLTITVEQSEMGGEEKKVSKFSLLDLAGSERAAKTRNRGQRLLEGANINRSLLALGNCINALCQNRKGAFVPYRDSKLTRLLKDSLGGNCRTVMIAAVSPSADQFEETVNTLKYANRAKNIKTKVTQNRVSVNYHISQYEDLIKGLRQEIASLKRQISVAPPGPPAGSPASAAGRTAAADGKEEDGAAAPSADPDALPLDEMRAALVANFQERMQLRRSLIELEAQNVRNRAEMERCRTDLARWEHAQAERARGAPPLGETKAPRGGGGGGESGDDDQENDEEDEDDEEDEEEEEGKGPSLSPLASGAKAERIRVVLSELQDSLDKNGDLRSQIMARLEANNDQASGLREALEKHGSSSDHRALLDLQYKVGILELDNMELEHGRMVHQEQLRSKDQEIRRLKLLIKARDRVIRAQKARLDSIEGLGPIDEADEAATDPGANQQAIAESLGYTALRQLDDRDVGPGRRGQPRAAWSNEVLGQGPSQPVGEFTLDDQSTPRDQGPRFAFGSGPRSAGERQRARATGAERQRRVRHSDAGGGPGRAREAAQAARARRDKPVVRGTLIRQAVGQAADAADALGDPQHTLMRHRARERQQRRMGRHRSPEQSTPQLQGISEGRESRGADELAPDDFPVHENRLGSNGPVSTSPEPEEVEETPTAGACPSSPAAQEVNETHLSDIDTAGAATGPQFLGTADPAAKPADDVVEIDDDHDDVVPVGRGGMSPIADAEPRAPGDTPIARPSDQSEPDFGRDSVSAAFGGEAVRRLPWQAQGQDDDA